LLFAGTLSTRVGNANLRQDTNGKTITLDVESLDTIANLKIKIQDKEALAPETQQLIFNNQMLLDNDKSLTDYSILAVSTLYLLAHPTPAPINSPFALSLLFLGIVAVAGFQRWRKRV